MEQLHERQKELIKKLGEIIQNTKDQNTDPKIYGKKLTQLDECWEKFENNDTEIREKYDTDRSHPYFIENIYDRTKKIYEKQREEMASEKRNMENSTKNNDTGESSSSAEKQATTFSYLDKLEQFQNDERNKSDLSQNNNTEESDHDDDIEINNWSNDDSIPDTVKVYFFLINEVKSAIKAAEKLNLNTTQGVASACLENLKISWSELRITHRKISVSANKDRCIDMNDLQSRYLTISGKLNDMVNGNSSKENVKLPKIKLPEFDGDKRNWRTFKDLFDRIVHNNASISYEIKIQYLKTNLTGNASKLVEHLPPTEANYKTCYQLLKNRYENERESVSDLIDEILDLKVQKNETSAGLKLIHDKTFECIMSIQSIGTSVENWDVLLIQILMRKLSEKTIMDYECKLANVKKTQTLAYFLQYLERRILALMSAEGKTKNNAEDDYEENDNEK